jgi:hypothetical protein
VSSFADRFDPAAYDDDAAVEFRAIFDAPQSPARRIFPVPVRLFDRLLHLASAYALPQLRAIEPHARYVVLKDDAQRVALELAFLDGVINDSLLGPRLRGMRSVAEECGRHDGAAWLVIDPP